MRVLIEFENKPLCFDDPSIIVSAYHLADVGKCLEIMEEALRCGFYLAGFFSYEAGYYFERSFHTNRVYDFPLLYFGLYNGLKNVGPEDPPESAQASLPRCSLSYEKYRSHIGQIRSQILCGNTYQITYCLKYLFDVAGSPYRLYRDLLKNQPVPYPAYIESDDFKILSLSPEMFFKKEKHKLTTKPMKGTWMRGKNLWDDLRAKRRLHLDPKNRAENVMIADLLRNDLGKISRPGTVHTPKLFEVARYATVCQMTSTVTGEVDPKIGISDLFRALFPSGSVTGAPKIKAMEIIRELEKEDRRIYTGAIGYITPQREMFFNVPIRTLLLRPTPSNPSYTYKGEMGVGGGITWYSTPEGEWDECRVKANFLAGDLL
jgi:para-aminobenzoate synthetase / 4-amino-4-deoxychorismate lyase